MPPRPRWRRSPPTPSAGANGRIPRGYLGVGTWEAAGDPGAPPRLAPTVVPPLPAAVGRHSMAEPSKELLDIPSEPKPPSFIESLLVGRDRHKEEGKRKAGPPTDPLPKSQVLGKVKDFLGEIAKANEKLQLDAQNKPPEEYDIEVLTGNEKEYIEMDLLLGVADLHSEKAVDAAEATMSGFPTSGISFASSSSDSEDDSEDSDEDGGDEHDISSKNKCKYPDEPQTHPAKGKKPNKRHKIVVLN